MSGAFAPGSMTWLLGIEDTCVHPPTGFEMTTLDEHDLTDHNRHWRADLDQVHALGATALRYGVDWPKVHVAPGNFDWSVLDERLAYAAGELRLTVIADLVHYGTPTWLDEAFADPRYPAAVAEFSGAFAARYRGLVDHVTPLNEPLTTASFCGLRGVWPPALSGWAGWTRVALGIIDGIRRSITAIRAANPDARIVHVEAAPLYEAADASLNSEARLLTAIAALPTDLLTGRVDDEHPMRGWLLTHGADETLLDSLLVEPPAIDLLGVNYYPDLSPRLLVGDVARPDQVAVNRWAEGLRDRILHFAEGFGAPVLVTETSIEGDELLRAKWLADSARAVLQLRREGLDIRGYTWWPLFDFIDWSWATGGRNVEEFRLDQENSDAVLPEQQMFADIAHGRGAFLRRMGLVALEEQPDGGLARVRTAAATEFHAITADWTSDRVG